jgi:ADP-ribose pyrophosphatase YjhB (NUDIX family)
MAKDKKMDITFNTSEGVFNYRVCAVILHAEKILAMHDERSPYFYLPGGRVNLKETAEHAVLREVREELNTKLKIARPLWINQSFFTEDVTKRSYHELCIYFLMDISDSNLLDLGEQFTLYEKKHTHKFEWLPFQSLKNEYFYPEFLKEKIFDLPDELTLITEYE